MKVGRETARRFMDAVLTSIGPKTPARLVRMNAAILADLCGGDSCVALGEAVLDTLQEKLVVDSVGLKPETFALLCQLAAECVSIGVISLADLASRVILPGLNLTTSDDVAVILRLASLLWWHDVTTGGDPGSQVDLTARVCVGKTTYGRLIVNPSSSFSIIEASTDGDVLLSRKTRTSSLKC
jgi:hypothetical protein